jgi:hypothetical protein
MVEDKETHNLFLQKMLKVMLVSLLLHFVLSQNQVVLKCA